jgi:hypothetical protein
VESALGYSWTINKDWKVGARVKFLLGVANASGKDLRATIATSPTDYAMTLHANALVKTAALVDLSDADFATVPDHIFDNTGFAFDAGVYYNTPVEGLSVGLSLVDWGWIDWTSNLKFYEAKTVGEGFEFSGLTDLNEGFDHIVDTLKNVFDFEDRIGTAYRTALPGKIYLSAAYNITKNDKFGFLFSTRALNNFARTTFSLMYNRSVGNWFSVAVGNNFMVSKIFNPSLALNLRGGAFQFYVAAENVSSFSAVSARTFNFRLGMNLTFMNF